MTESKVKRRGIQMLNAAVDAAEKKQRRSSSRKRSKVYSEAERKALLKSAQGRFFDYCCLMAPDFYKPDRAYLVELCDAMQSFYEDPDAEVLIVNMPPRHGKSRTATLFTQWVFGVDPSEKVMTGSYNEMLSTNFSKNVRDALQEVKLDQARICYSDVFPDTKIKQGDAAAQFWTIEGEYASYLATSPTGTATGFGCSLLIIDDIIKNAYEANNQTILDNHWSWFTNTMLSRLEEGGKIIIIMTRWASKDLAGRAIDHFCDVARVVTMKAEQDDGTMLCEAVLSKESYRKKVAAMGADIAAANYQQEPIDLKGTLYQAFKTYETVPTNSFGKPLFTEIRAYIDTADTGSDYLCGIVYGVYNKEAYVLDVLYTKEPMEITEPTTAKMLHEHKVNRAKIESNNGGRGFARAVERLLQERHRSNYTKVEWFSQTHNKQARILSNATWVQEHIYFPVNWRNRWPEYHKSMTSYQREGKNKHDDAQDATTGIAENCSKSGGGFVNVLM